jgi:oligopeptide transport system substrate-binding protein
MRRVLLSALIFLTACDKTPSKSELKSLKINISSDPQTLDCRKVRSLEDINVSKMLMDGLTRINQKGVPDLSLAERVSVSLDQKTYTFILRDAKWTDNTPVTAYDFVYAWKKTLSPQFMAPNASLLYSIKNAESIKNGLIPSSMLGVEAVDAKTLIISLSQPTPYFLDLLSHPAFFPVNAKIDQTNPDWMKSPETYVGCGPFKLCTWQHDDLLLVEKNPSYWDSKAVKLDQINMIMVDATTEIQLFKAKELDWVGSPFSIIPVDEITQLKDLQTLYTKPTLSTTFLRTNTLTAPFNSQAMRKAFALAINRGELIDHLSEGTQLPATGLVPPSMGLEPTSYFTDGDIEHAVELFNSELARLNISKEQLPAITLKYAASERNHQMMQAIQQQWQSAFGIQVSLMAVETKVLFSDITSKNYQLAAGSWIADVNDPINFLEVFRTSTSNTNNTAWENGDYVKALDASYQCINPEERAHLLSQSEKIIMDEMPIIPLYHITMLYSNQNGITNTVISPMGLIDFKWANLEKTHE